MFRKEMAAKNYKVLKTFVFRGVQYEPGETFDPVDAQCIPSKLGILMRQRLLGDEGPSLTEALKKATPPASPRKQDAEDNSDAKSAKRVEASGVKKAVRPQRRRQS